MSNEAGQREASFWGNVEQASKEVKEWPRWKQEPYEANLPQKKSVTAPGTQTKKK